MGWLLPCLERWIESHEATLAVMERRTVHPSVIAQIQLQRSFEIIIALMKGHSNDTTQTRQ